MRIDPNQALGYLEFDDDYIVDLVAENFSPGYVFEVHELETWALEHGFTREDNGENK